MINIEDLKTELFSRIMVECKRNAYMFRVITEFPPTITYKEG